MQKWVSGGGPFTDAETDEPDSRAYDFQGELKVKGRRHNGTTEAPSGRVKKIKKIATN